MSDFGNGTPQGLYGIKTGALGSALIGAFDIGGQIDMNALQAAAPTSTLAENSQYTSSWGVGFYGARIYSKPLVVTIVFTVPIDADSIGITFYNKDKAVMGKLRTDIQNPIISELSFQIDDTGSGDGKITLSELPSFPLIPFSNVGITIGKSRKENYKGFLRINNEPGSTKDEIELEINSLREQMKGIHPDRSISGPADVGVSVKDIFDTDILPNTDIKFDAGTLQVTTGVTHASNLDLGKDDAETVFNSLAEMASAESGVTGDGAFFFEVKSSTVLKVFSAGKNLDKFEPRRDIEGVKNSVLAKRNQVSGSGDSGWTTASIASDATSQAIYGFRELIIKIPGYFADADADIITAALLADLKDPKFSAQCEINIDAYTDLINRGNYKFIGSFEEFSEDITECDSLDNFNITATGDLAQGIVTSPILSGSGSLKLTYTNGFEDRTTYTLTDTLNFVQKLRIFIRSNKTGSYLNVAVGTGSIWNEKVRLAPVNISAEFQLFEWDLNAVGINALKQVSIQILDNSGIANTVYIDKIQAVIKGNKHYEMRMKRVRYRYKDGQLRAKADFGSKPSEMQGFIKELLRYAVDNESAGEER